MTAYYYSRCSDVHLTRNRHDQRITKEPSLCNIIEKHNIRHVDPCLYMLFVISTEYVILVRRHVQRQVVCH